MGGESGVHLDGLWCRTHQSPSVYVASSFTGFPNIAHAASAYDVVMSRTERTSDSLSDARELDEIARALSEGRVTRSQVLQVLNEASPHDAPRIASISILMTIGMIVMYLGAVLVYSVSFADYANTVQLTTPFLFPVVVGIALAVVIRRGARYWQQEIIMSLALLSTVVASIVSMTGRPGVDEVSWIQVCAIGWIGIGIAAWMLRRTMRSPMILTCGGIIGLLMTTLERIDYAGHWYVPTLSLAATFLVAGAAVWSLLHRGWGEVMIAAGYITGYIGVMQHFDAMHGDITSLTWGHVLLSLLVASAFVIAPAMRMPLMYVPSAVGTMLWLSTTIPVATQSIGWALIVMAMGAAIVAASIATNVVRHRRLDRTDHRGTAAST